MTRRAQFHAKIVAPILAAAVVAAMIINLPGLSKSVSLRAENSEIAQAASIDIWQLHLQADIDHMPALMVADPV